MDDKARAVEIDDVVEPKKDDAYPGLQLDERGLPLIPQPSDHKDDPLVSRRRLNVESQL